MLSRDPSWVSRLQEEGASSKYDAIHCIGKSLGYGIYVIVDDYDYFTNEILASAKGEVSLKEITDASRFYRGWFQLFKGTCDRVFLTGTTLVTLDGLTSGYNIGTDITQEDGYNEVLGFTEDETRKLFEDFQETGLYTDPAETHLKTVKEWYGNYCFVKRQIGESAVYNPDNIHHYLHELVTTGYPPKDLVNVTIRDEWSKLSEIFAVQNHDKTENGILPFTEKLAEGNEIMIFPFYDSFPFDQITEKRHFMSLYYFFGLVVPSRVYHGDVYFRVPNESVRQGLLGCIQATRSCGTNVNESGLEEVSLKK